MVSKRGKKHTRTSHKKRRGGDIGSWFRDLGSKIKNEFTNPNSKLGQVGQKIKNEFVNPDSKLGQFGRKVKNEFVNPKSDFRKAFYRDGVLRQKILPAASTILGGIPILGTALKAASAASSGANLLGYGKRKKKSHKKKRHTRK